MCSKVSKFKSDLNGEMVLSEFLEKFFYSKLKLDDFFRNTPDKVSFLDNQYSGIDVKFKFNGIEYIVDEKAALHYPNSLPTFAFELKYKKDNEWKTGWLFDNNKQTEYYLLAWVKRNDVNLEDLTLDDIKNVEVMLIKRNDIHDYLNQTFGLTQSKIDNEVDKIIEANKYGKLYTIHPESCHYYYYTENLAETPINIVIQKSTLKNLAKFHFIVYRNTPYAQQTDYHIWLKERYLHLQNNNNRNF